VLKNPLAAHRSSGPGSPCGRVLLEAGRKIPERSTAQPPPLARAMVSERRLFGAAICALTTASPPSQPRLPDPLAAAKEPGFR
jgi:hypothetical protein